MAETTTTGAAASPARKRTTTRRRPTRARAGAAASTAAATAPKKRGRPVGSRNKRTVAASPAEALTKRVQALVKENEQLKAQVKDLEAGWRKLEKALGANVTRAKRSVRKRARRVTRAIDKAIDNVTS